MTEETPDFDVTDDEWVEATTEATAGSLWEPIEDRWGAEVLNPLPHVLGYWAELWQALPEAGAGVTVVIATAVDGEYGPEPVKVAQAEFSDLDVAKAWAQEWRKPEPVELPELPSAPA